LFLRTCDIAEFLDLLADSGLRVPTHAVYQDEFNPFAVEMRYGLLRCSVRAWRRSKSG